MKKTVPFDFFRDGDTIYFDIGRLLKLERLSGTKYGELFSVIKENEIDIANVGYSLNFTLCALQVGLGHIYPTATKEWYIDQIDKMLDNSKHALLELQTVVLNAVISGGAPAEPTKEEKEEAAKSEEEIKN